MKTRSLALTTMSLFCALLGFLAMDVSGGSPHPPSTVVTGVASSGVSPLAPCGCNLNLNFTVEDCACFEGFLNLNAQRTGKCTDSNDPNGGCEEIDACRIAILFTSDTCESFKFALPMFDHCGGDPRTDTTDCPYGGIIYWNLDCRPCEVPQ